MSESETKNNKADTKEVEEQTDPAILALHRAICACPKCKGTCDKSKLCKSCLKIDKMIDETQVKRSPNAK